MSTKKIKLVDATNAQALEYAQRLGLDAKMGQQTAFLVNMIRTAHPGIEEIEVEDTTAPAAVSEIPEPRREVPEVTDRMMGITYREDPKVTLSIPSQDKPGGKRDVQVAVNGVPFLIRRDMPVEVPYRVFEALDNSRQTEYEQVDGPTATSPKVMQAYTTHGYPFSVVKPADPAAVQEWRERTAAHFAP